MNGPLWKCIGDGADHWGAQGVCAVQSYRGGCEPYVDGKRVPAASEYVDGLRRELDARVARQDGEIFQG